MDDRPFRRPYILISFDPAAVVAVLTSDGPLQAYRTLEPAHTLQSTRFPEEQG